MFALGLCVNYKVYVVLHNGDTYARPYIFRTKRVLNMHLYEGQTRHLSV